MQTTHMHVYQTRACPTPPSSLPPPLLSSRLLGAAPSATCSGVGSIVTISKGSEERKLRDCLSRTSASASGTVTRRCTTVARRARPWGEMSALASSTATFAPSNETAFSTLGLGASRRAMEAHDAILAGGGQNRGETSACNATGTLAQSRPPETKQTGRPEKGAREAARGQPKSETDRRSSMHADHGARRDRASRRARGTPGARALARQEEAERRGGAPASLRLTAPPPTAHRLAPPPLPPAPLPSFRSTGAPVPLVPLAPPAPPARGRAGAGAVGGTRGARWRSLDRGRRLRVNWIGVGVPGFVRTLLFPRAGLSG